MESTLKEVERIVTLYFQEKCNLQVVIFETSIIQTETNKTSIGIKGLFDDVVNLDFVFCYQTNIFSLNKIEGVFTINKFNVILSELEKVLLQLNLPGQQLKR